MSLQMAGQRVFDAAGRDGVVLEQDAAHAEGAEPRVLVSFEDGVWSVPASLLEPQRDGAWRLPQDVTELEGRMDRLLVAEEELVVGKREKARRVLIRKHVETRSEDVEVPLESTEVEIERVAIGELVETAPQTRVEGDVTIIPVLEERLVVETRLFLKEEIHIRERRSSETYRDSVILREEVVTIERDADPVVADVVAAAVHESGLDDILPGSSAAKRRDP